MSSSKRECATCQYFQNAHLAGNGWCTHPNRQLASDVRLLVRAKELACRNSWGDDMWVDKELPTTTSPAPTPRSGGMIYVATHADDEVTSVIDTTAKDAANPAGKGQDGSEDQVTHTSVRSDLPASTRRSVHDPNIPANDDQDDRVRIMARGSRDAILRARERHAQRRTPSRPMIDPMPPESDDAGDQVIESRDRHHYSPPTDKSATPPDTSAGRGQEITPPVPREEVHGKGTGLSPAVGPDARFDSIPDVKGDIELPRLRQFLHGSQAGTTGKPPAPTQLPDVSVSSYDLVLRRAREIKASAAGEPQPQRPIPSRPAPPPTGPESAAAQSPPDAPAPPARQLAPEPPTVVWDLDPDDIRVAFQRVREAIDKPLPMRLAPPARTDAQVVEESGSSLMPPVRNTDPALMTYGEDVSDGDDWYPEEAEHEGSDASSYVRRPQPESPRASWWRSLNFGIRRRVSHDVRRDLARTYEYESEWHDPESFDALDPVYDDEAIEPVHAAAGHWEEYHEPASGLDDDDPGFIGEYDPDDEFEQRQEADAARLATSEESWLEDELEFPEPQPAEWHETRAALLAQRPAIQDDEVRPLVPAPSQPPADTGFRTKASPGSYLAPAPPRQPPTYFAIDQPGGMTAFRAALFGADDAGSERTDPARSTPAEPWADSRPPRDSTPPPSRERAIEASPTTSPRWQPSGPVRPATRFERGSSLDIPDEILARDDGPRTFDVASRVPKCCRTCRSFRPSDNRDQGWCMNGDAFTHRQMVNADMLSCRSSIGDWWLAADQSWIPPEDVIRPETPRTDRLMERQDSKKEPSRQDGRGVRTRRAV